MKYLLLMHLTLFCIKVNAQTATGFVIEKDTRKPVPYIVVL
jgi:hypothetical protein